MIILINGSSLICPPFNGQPVKGVHISYIGPFLYDVFEGVSLIYRFSKIYRLKLQYEIEHSVNP